jgi:hypothetical protein
MAMLTHNIQKYRLDAPSGNRTQGSSMATTNFTTKPMVRDIDICLRIFEFKYCYTLFPSNFEQNIVARYGLYEP